MADAATGPGPTSGTGRQTTAWLVTDRVQRRVRACRSLGRHRGLAGSYGVQPDVLDRMRWCRDQVRGWMREAAP